MKFLRNLFAIENPTRTCLIWGCLILLVLTTDALMQGNRLRTDGPVIAVAAPQTMTIRFGEERRQVRLARGEQVRLLGIRRYTYQQEYLVETESGDRGWLQADLLPVRQIIVKGEHEGDTVRLTGQKCRHLETIAFDREEFVKSEYRTGAEIKTGKLLGTSYSWKQTWDEVTYLHRNQEGRSWTTKRKENIRNHKMEHRTYEMIDYEVTYRIDHFRDHYRCGRCDFRELLDTTKWTETDRQKRGSHTSTHTHEV